MVAPAVVVAAAVAAPGKSISDSQSEARELREDSETLRRAMVFFDERPGDLDDEP